ncbi:MAG: PAS domain-containing protein [Pseudomonadota bacterium]
MPFQKTSADVIRSVRQRWLLGHWSRARGEQAVPSWKNLAADDLAKMAENLLFCDVAADDNARFLVRFRGARIVETLGARDAKYLDEILPAVIREETLMAYKEAVRAKQPVFTISDTRDSAGKTVNLERLLLPFSRDGTAVDRILGSLEMVSIEGSFNSRNLLNEQSPPTHLLRAIIQPA